MHPISSYNIYNLKSERPTAFTSISFLDQKLVTVFQRLRAISTWIEPLASLLCLLCIFSMYGRMLHYSWDVQVIWSSLCGTYTHFSQ